MNLEPYTISPHYADYEWNNTWSWNHFGLCWFYTVVGSSQGLVYDSCRELWSILDLLVGSLHEFYSLSFLLFPSTYKVYL